MGTIGFGHVNMRAPRALLEQLYGFYTSVVGLTPGERPPFARHGYWLYAGGQDILHLLEASPDEQRATHVTTTIDHIAFRCQDHEHYQARLEQLGIPFRVTRVPLTGQLQLVIKDPAGVIVELNFPAPDANQE